MISGDLFLSKRANSGLEKETSMSKNQWIDREDIQNVCCSYKIVLNLMELKSIIKRCLI